MKKLIALIAAILTVPGCKGNIDNTPVVFVSILPQKYFVEKIAGDIANIEVMVRPGFNPVSYKPAPKQFSLLEKSDLFFTTGVPFEKSWIPKIKSNYPNLNICPVQKGIKLRVMKENHHHEEHENELVHNHEDKVLDPHIWLDPVLVKKQAENIKNGLVSQYPDKKEIFEENYLKFIAELTELNSDLQEKFKPFAGKKFMVFHPTWGYFADRFNIEQVPIETGGKEPTSAQLLEILSLAKKENIRVIFIQKQFSIHIAESIAEEIKGEIISLDPLAYDYIMNLRKIATEMTEAFKRN